MPVLHCFFQTMHDFIMNTQEREDIAAMSKKKMVKKKITVAKKKTEVKKEKETEKEKNIEGTKNTDSDIENKPNTSGDVEDENEVEEVEVEVEETAEEMEERCIRENSERIAKELADAQHEVSEINNVNERKCKERTSFLYSIIDSILHLSCFVLHSTMETTCLLSFISFLQI